MKALPSLRTLTAGAALTAALAAAPAPAAEAAPSCTRGGARLEAASKTVRVVRQRLPRTHAGQTRRERLLACWAPTGRRVTIVEEVDHGDDNRARSGVEIVGDRWVGVVAVNEGGVSISQVARVFDARTRRLVHDSRACDAVDQGDFRGVSDVAFLDGGGMAMACRQLLLLRGTSKQPETIEPAGTYVTQLGVSRWSEGFRQRLFWTVLPDGALEPVTRSMHP